MTTLLKILLALLGGSIMLISLAHVALGPVAIPGAVPVNATMDSEDRFYAVFFLAYGAALLWCARDIQGRTRHIRLLMALFFLGGVARIVSMAQVGLPNTFFIAMTGVELGLPPLVIWLAGRVRAKA